MDTFLSGSDQCGFVQTFASVCAQTQTVEDISTASGLRYYPRVFAVMGFVNVESYRIADESCHREMTQLKKKHMLRQSDYVLMYRGPDEPNCIAPLSEQDLCGLPDAFEPSFC